MDRLRSIIASSTEVTLQEVISEFGFATECHSDQTNIIPTINKLLSNPKTCQSGLELLNVLIPQFSSPVLMANVHNWLSFCLRSPQGDSLKGIKLLVIEKLLKNTNDSELNLKKNGIHFISELIGMCLSAGNDAGISPLRCLIQSMKLSPGIFVNYKQKIELFLISYLDVDNKSCVKYAATAFHLLQQTGSAGVDATNFRANFTSQFHKVSKTIDGLFDTFFDGIFEVNTYNRKNQEVFLFDNKGWSDSKSDIEHTALRIINCCLFMEAMIGQKFPVEKQISLKDILSVICRGLEVHICQDSEKTSVTYKQHSLLLLRIQLRLMKLLHLLIRGYFPSLFPFSHSLSRVLVNNLKRSNECKCFSACLPYKKNSYKVLNEWLFLTGSLKSSLSFASIIPIVMTDVSFYIQRPMTYLSTSKGDLTKRKEKQVSIFCSDSILPQDDCVKGETCLEAMKCMELLIKLCCDSKVLQPMVSFVTQTLISLQMGKSDSFNLSLKCQVRLYEVLVSLVKLDRTDLPLPINLITTLLINGQKSTNYEISNISGEGLRIIKKIVQPVCMSLCTQKLSELQTAATYSELQVNVKKPAEVTTEPDSNESGGIKKINVLSHIVIQKPIIQKMSHDENVDEQEQTKSDMEHSCDENDSVIKPVSNEVLLDNEIEGEPLRKKSRVADSEPPVEEKSEAEQGSLNELLSSFHDLPQEQ